MQKPNSQMQAVLDAHAEMGPLPIETLTAKIARQIPLADRAAAAVYGQHFMKRAVAPMPMPVGSVKHQQITGAESEVLLRIYTPTGHAPKGGWPVTVYFHGGGWVIATLDTYDSSCRALCQGAECIIVSAHYRQAPEHPFPAAFEDAVAAYQWTLANAAVLGGNPSQIAVAGESAGGNLAAVVSLAARDQGMPMPVHQLLVYPVTNLLEGPLSDSARTNAKAKPLNTPMLHWFYDQYVPNHADRSNPYASPLKAELHNLPTATIILAEIDPLMTEGHAYADKLRAAGVPVKLNVYAGVTHEFFSMVGLVSEATDAMKFACDSLQEAFAGQSLSTKMAA